MSLVKKILPRFPISTIRSSFGYGSSVFPQPGNEGKDRQIDLILITDNPLEFHRQNLAKNKDDYSYFMKAKSADSIANWNSKATGLYFNQFVKTEFGELKYGVISTQDFINDLTKWHHLYVAGRLHKPVKFVTPVDGDMTLSLPPKGDELYSALQSNLNSALRISSLLIKNEKTNFDELVHQICNLSYLGDIRKKGFEDTGKVDKIFEGSYQYLQQLYDPVIQNASWLKVSADGSIYKDVSAEALAKQILLLPQEVKVQSPSNEDLTSEISRIVSTSSKSQTWINFWTAGPVRSTKYGFAKVKKFTKSLK